MYDMIWVIPTIISVSMFGFSLFMILMESLQRKNMFRFFVWLIAFILFFGTSAYCCDMLCKECSESEARCINLGYQSTQHNNDSWYCITYGNEPKIIKLEGEQ